MIIIKQSKQRKVKANHPFPLWIGVVIVAFILLVAAVTLLQKPQGQSAVLPTEVSVEQASIERDQGAFILDVRQPDEWQQLHIPGATLIPLGELPNRLNEVPKDQKIVVVCRSGNRSAQGRDILLGAGYEQVTSMAGGVTQWQKQGLPIATGQ